MCDPQLFERGQVRGLRTTQIAWLGVRRRPWPGRRDVEEKGPRGFWKSETQHSTQPHPGGQGAQEWDERLFCFTSRTSSMAGKPHVISGVENVKYTWNVIVSKVSCCHHWLTRYCPPLSSWLHATQYWWRMMGCRLNMQCRCMEATVHLSKKKV